jgi:hypothetical protein
MQLPVTFTKCHGGQSYLKSQKWLIRKEVTNAWVGMDMIFCSGFGLLMLYMVISPPIQQN